MPPLSSRKDNHGTTSLFTLIFTRLIASGFTALAALLVIDSAVNIVGAPRELALLVGIAASLGFIGFGLYLLFRPLGLNEGIAKMRIEVSVTKFRALVIAVWTFGLATIPALYVGEHAPGGFWTQLAISAVSVVGLLVAHSKLTDMLANSEAPEGVWRKASVLRLPRRSIA